MTGLHARCSSSRLRSASSTPASKTTSSAACLQLWGMPLTGWSRGVCLQEAQRECCFYSHFVITLFCDRLSLQSLLNSYKREAKELVSSKVSTELPRVSFTSTRPPEPSSDNSPHLAFILSCSAVWGEYQCYCEPCSQNQQPPVRRHVSRAGGCHRQPQQNQPKASGTVGNMKVCFNRHVSIIIVLAHLFLSTFPC